MLFPTAEFFVFFTVVFLLYWYVFTKAADRKILLVVASFVFYSFFSFGFAVLMIALTAINSGFGLALTKIKNFKPRKAILIVATAFNILYLLYFKEAYSLLSFLNNSFPQLFSEATFLKLLSATAIIPLGVSYYVFKCCSYLFDVYLGKIPAHKSFINLTLYITFFPQIFSGPIVHAAYFFEHLQQALEADKNAYDCIPFDRAASLILLGLIKKMIVATVLSILVTTPVFSAPMTFNTLELLFAAVAYSVVIYADFSGYSDMAIGIALLLGFETPANFNRPYTAKSVTDFWKRWHISFSSWLRDYVYFAFGGSRFGIVRTMLALFFTMLIAGVWHGAKFTFLIWGAFQGLALCIERLFAKTYAEGEGQTLAQNLEVANIEEASLLEKAKTRHQKEGLKPRHSAKKYLHTAGTFLFITFSWIFFRSENLTEAGLYFASLRNLTLPFQVVSPLCVLLVVAGIGFQFIPESISEKLFGIYAKFPLALKAVLFACAFVAMNLFTTSGIPEFIYFRF